MASVLALLTPDHAVGNVEAVVESLCLYLSRVPVQSVRELVLIVLELYRNHFRFVRVGFSLRNQVYVWIHDPDRHQTHSTARGFLVALLTEATVHNFTHVYVFGQRLDFRNVLNVLDYGVRHVAFVAHRSYLVRSLVLRLYEILQAFLELLFDHFSGFSFLFFLKFFHLSSRF